jgi:3-oxoacyl-[acyl-carrier-protein] synthase-3
MKAYIKYISYYLPDATLSNEDLVKNFPKWNAEKVAQKVGINVRHISDPDETAGDMAVKAAKILFEKDQVSPLNIDFILFCTQSPDFHLPSTACLIQDKLGVPCSAGALDFDLGCSGYEYGLAMAKGLILGDMAKNVLLLTAETYTKYIHPDDKGNRSIFGDAASASLISTSGFAEIGNFVFGTDGRGATNLMVKSGGARQKEKLGDISIENSGYMKSSDYLYMNGPEIFNFTLDVVPSLVKNVLEKNCILQEDIDEYIFHQANKFMLDTVRKVASLPKDKFYVDLLQTGNTVSSTVPIALKNYMDGGGTAKHIMLAGFGVGYSWSGCVINLYGV